ncbi:Thiosulfate sulfurtransferase glpE [Chlamydia trachomatis]|nr:Thiosulfate sulfurtransferase glpE [Chlamydia trachomatis]
MQKSLTTSQLAQLLERQSIQLLDVREASEYAAGHIPRAINLPLSTLGESISRLDKETPYHVVCQMGGRSARACQFLEENGFDVTNVTGGTDAFTGPLEQ